MDLNEITKLHNRCLQGDCDLYTFLEQEFPDISIEERLKIMAEILNEFLEEYYFDTQDKLKRDDYSITRFFPKN